MKSKISKRTIVLILLVFVALVSAFGISKLAASPKLHTSTIEALDQKRGEVMALTATMSVAATGIATIPGDASTPLANQILQLSSYLIFVIGAIMLEKYLITVTGYITFGLLIPAACALLAVYLYKRNQKLKILAIKLIVFGVAIFAVIPISVQFSNIIDKTYQQSAQIVEQELESLKENKEENDNFIDKVVEMTSDVAVAAKEKLNLFIDQIAALLITSCVIPVAVMFFFTWIIKIIFGISIKLPKSPKIKKIQNRDEEVEKICIED